MSPRERYRAADAKLRRLTHDQIAATKAALEAHRVAKASTENKWDLFIDAQELVAKTGVAAAEALVEFRLSVNALLLNGDVAAAKAAIIH